MYYMCTHKTEFPKGNVPWLSIASSVLGNKVQELLTVAVHTQQLSLSYSLQNYYQFSGCKPRSGSLASIHSGNIEQVTVSSNLCAGETTPCSPVTTPCSPVTTPSLRSDKEFVNGNALERACTKGKHPRTKQVFYPARKYQTVSTGVECSDV